jgi:monoamine oxidase
MRTPPMQSLIQMSRRCAMQEAIRTNRGGLTRRALLGAGVAVTAGGLLARFDAAHGRAAQADTEPRIGIVGAGIAGLSAALTLQDAGYTATVYDAADGVGGRMHSNTTTWAESQTSEWCGEFIDSDHATMLALARRFNLPLVDLLADDLAGAQPTHHFLGQYYPIADFERDFAPVATMRGEQITVIGQEIRYDQVTPDAFF